MGYSVFGSGSNRGKTCCDGCGPGVGRKRPCPYGYCSAVRYCKACWEGGAKEKSAAYHKAAGCKEKHERHVAAEVARAAQLAAGQALLASAMNVGEGRVHVIFRKGNGICEGLYMSEALYESVPSGIFFGPCPTPESYAALGPVEPAPGEFHYGRTTKEVR